VKNGEGLGFDKSNQNDNSDLHKIFFKSSLFQNKTVKFRFLYEEKFEVLKSKGFTKSTSKKASQLD